MKNKIYWTIGIIVAIVVLFAPIFSFNSCPSGISPGTPTKGGLIGFIGSKNCPVGLA